jgi:predicted DNA-binding protein (MmcQ/YjbR family)
VTLSGAQLQQTARDTAASLAHVSHGRDKVFLIVTEDDPELQIITVKVDPHHGDALRRDHESITPGHYLDKGHWISVGAGRGVTKRLVEDLVHGSYELAAGHQDEERS